MFWTFISLASITLAASLLGLAAVWTVRRPLAAWHGLAIAFLIVAWFAEHTTLSGRLCLVAAMAVEALAWWASRGNERANPPTATLSGSPQSPPTPPRSEPLALPQRPVDVTPPRKPPGNAAAASSDRAAHPPADCVRDSDSSPPPVSLPKPEPLRLMTTYVLLRAACTVAPAVFLASLRRCGRRDVTLAASESDGVSGARGDDESLCRIVAGDIMLTCNSVPAPVDSVRIKETLARLDDAAPAAEAAGEHVARITVTTTHRIAAARDDAVRLHHHAHAALAEFAPVAASFWPEAGLLATLDELPHLLAQAKDPTARMSRTCTQLRRFPLEVPNEGMILLDSLGLSAFGLPDIQIIAADPPDEAVTTALVDLVERVFVSGCALENGSSFTMGDQTLWRVSRVRSAFAPDREVVQLAVGGPE